MRKVCGLLMSFGVFGVLLSSTVNAESIDIEVNSRVTGSSNYVVSKSLTLTENTSSERKLEDEEMMQEKKDELKDRMEKKQEELEQRKDEMKEKIASRQADLNNKLDENTKERIRKTYERHIRRLLATAERLENILGRINSRLDKNLNNSNYDVSSLIKKVESLTVEIGSLKENIASKVDSMDIVFDSTDPKTMYVVLKDELETYHNEIKLIFGKIRGLIPELEKLHSKEVPEVSVTKSETDN